MSEIGFIGAGSMGGPMVHNLLAGGHAIRVFDVNRQRLEECGARGATAAESVSALVDRCDLVMMSLPFSRVLVDVAETEMLPRLRPGQVMIDLGTTTPHETRRLAGLFEHRGATWLDVPVSGGPSGVKQKRLRMFGAGPREKFDEIVPILQSLGGSEHIVYCGPSGNGQIVKGVNQLMMGLAQAAFTEAASFGVNAGIEADILLEAVGGQGWLREDFARVVRKIAEGQGEQVEVKFRELPYFLDEAARKGFPLPLTRALHRFCDAGERRVIDHNVPSPSFYYELCQAGRGAVPEKTS